MIEPRTLKGFRDFLPQDAKRRQFVISELRLVFEKYGFDPLETPTLEYEDILNGKYGEEGDKLMYRFEDNGGRRVALRYDQTVPLARVIAQHRNEISFPFKRYQIQNVFRADNTQRGRFREFLQCDIDTVGSDSPQADIEIIKIVQNAFSRLGFSDIKILVNDRSLFQDIPKEAIPIIDKIKKIGKDGVVQELISKNIDPLILERLMLSNPTERMEKILDSCQNTQFEPTLARGLDYYTSTIIEVESQGYSGGSLGGGGRYDELIGMFLNENIPSVGFAFGFDRILEAMTELNLFPKKLSSTSVLVTVFDNDHLAYSSEIAEFLRDKGVITELYLDPNAKMEKQLKYADKKGMHFAIIAGSDEMSARKVTVKNLLSRTQESVHFTESYNAITVHHTQES